MRRKNSHLSQGKRAVYAGLFLGVLLGTAGCVKPTVSPGITDTPVPVPTGEVLPTPGEVTSTPEPYLTEGAPTPELLPTASAEPTEEPAASATPEVISPTPVPTPEPTVTPEPTASPEPEPTENPEEELTATPGPEPTESPAYDTLLDNGWQRAEDFFGCREIFFSGIFYDAELIAEPGRYEYRYRALSEEEVSFSVIGEEHLTVQQFLDELVQKTEEYRLEPEGAEDYRYYYIAEEMQVSGRIYACIVGETEHRMRVERRYPADTAEQTEGYDFYLR